MTQDSPPGRDLDRDRPGSHRPAGLTLRTTNPIDNLFGSVRKVSKRVKRWRGGRMMLRWCATSVLDAKARFRRVKGHAEMPRLVAALRAHEGAVDQPQAVA